MRDASGRHDGRAFGLERWLRRLSITPLNSAWGREKLLYEG